MVVATPDKLGGRLGPAEGQGGKDCPLSETPSKPPTVRRVLSLVESIFHQEIVLEWVFNCQNYLSWNDCAE